MKVLIFEVDEPIDNSGYQLLKQEIETSLKQGYVILRNGLKLREVEIQRERPIISSNINLEGSGLFNEKE